MEFLASHIPSSPQILSRSPLLRSRFSITALDKKAPAFSDIPISHFPLKPPLLTFLPLSTRRSLRISAHFGRHSPRRNSLRKKLAENPQVRQNPPPALQNQNPTNRAFDVLRDSGSNLGDYSIKENAFKPLDNDNLGEPIIEKGSKSKTLGGSNALFEELDNWVSDFKNDTELWGIGSGPIFTVFQDSDGKIRSVSVNDDEISRRCGQHFQDSTMVAFKCELASNLAKEIESGGLVLPKSSSIAKFVVSGERSSIFSNIQGVVLQPDMFLKFSGAGFVLLCGSLVFLGVKRLLKVGEHGVEDMRLNKNTREKVTVELMQESVEPLASIHMKRPELDKQELMKSILNARMSEEESTSRNSFRYQSAESTELETKIQEIREMARHAREIEAADVSEINTDEEENSTEDDKMSNKREGVILSFKDMDVQNHAPDRELPKNEVGKALEDDQFLKEPKSGVNGISNNASCFESEGFQYSTSPAAEVSVEQNTASEDGQTFSRLDSIKVEPFSDAVDDELSMSGNSSFKRKPRIIRSVNEARKYLSEKQEAAILHDYQETPNAPDLRRPNIESDSLTNVQLDMTEELSNPSLLGGMSSAKTPVNAFADNTSEKRQFASGEIENLEDVREQSVVSAIEAPDCQSYGSSTEMKVPLSKENGMDKNFEEFKPIIEKIGVGFRNNYRLAKEKVNQQLAVNSDISQLANEDDDELEWMKDDSLRNIVYRVRENELAGHVPFYNMDAEDKLAFYKGLEKKAEKVNENLMKVHEYIHSNIENVDYGADGISLYDPVEKVVPRWKGPSVDKDPKFLNNFLDQRKAFATGKSEMSYPAKKDVEDSLQKSEESLLDGNSAMSSGFYNAKMKSDSGVGNSKTIIESSDGYVRAGKRSGKEFWEHTKKWSRGFLEVYNAESDPEVKSSLKDMGKDLNRWITEKEIKEAADLISELPERKKEFIEKRINKLKREMELYGPQAVVSKYREYAEEKEEDYLWWLDLPCVLCIELYTYDNGNQKIGFYSLEMAADLELNPKQYHVVAFEDLGDCKNLCYIIQAHKDMLGSSHAFVVARPPKDAFREAKANGFSVTVVRKGELSLNVDQTLEEVEEQITEIGSKIYHDSIMQERSVDISTLMKGVLGANKPNTRRRVKRFLKKRIKDKRH